MNTIFVNNPTDKDLQKAADIILSGGLVAFPTETVYGLGANALMEDAASKIYKAKNRPSDNPLIIHLNDYSNVEKYCVAPDVFYDLAEKFMPGPLTVILKKKSIIPYTVTGGLETVAVRIPSNKTANRFLEFCGVPVAAPSANLSGKPSCTTAFHVLEDMNGRIDMILNGGDSEIGLESTIIIPEDNNILTLLRPGKISVEMLEKAGYKVKMDKAVSKKLDDNERPLAPGMKYRHYAPTADLILIDGDDSNVERYMLEKLQSPENAVIGFDDYKAISDKADCIVIGSSSDKETQAHKLFDVLRLFDNRQDIKRIYAKLPSTEGIGLAVFNRMLKASGYNIIILKHGDING